MTEPVTAIAAVTKVVAKELGKTASREAIGDAVRGALRVHRIIGALEREDPLAAIHASYDILRSIPLRTEYAGLFSGLNAATGRGDALRERLGVRGVVYRGQESLDELRRAVGDDEGFTIIVPSLTDLAAAEQQLLRAAHERGVVLTARRTEFVIGSDYEEGPLTQVPLAGSSLRLAFKGQLGENITAQDLIRAGADIATIITLAVAAPVAAPAGGVAGTAGGEAVSATTGTAATGTVEATSGLSVSAAVVDTTSISQVEVAAAASDVQSITEARIWAGGETFELPASFAHPGHLRERFAAIEPHLDGYAEHLLERDEAWANMCRRNVDRLLQAREVGPGEVQRVMGSIKRNASGEFARQLTLDGFKPFFTRHKIEVPVRIDEVGTRIDVRFEGARVGIAGRGGFYVPKDGSCAVEVKAGGSDYLRNEFDHLVLQGKHGRSVSDAAITVTTKDVKGLEAALESRLREALRPTSPLYKFLPEKRVIDRAVCDLHERLAQAAMRQR